MGQPGMRVTVDAAMRARDVSRSWPDDDDADGRRPADAAPASPGRSRWQRSATGPDRADGPDHTDRADRAEGGEGADRRTDGAGHATGAGDGDSRDGGGGEHDDTAPRERRGKGDRRRLGKRHARARR